MITLHGNTNLYNVLHANGLVSSVSRALSSKLRGLGFKSRPGQVGGSVTIIMWDAQPG